ncbi:MAG: N-acetylmuramic acid 6-phosphate etherase [Limnochordia bacterium]|jgi:N-acetylmuramic acid 6-phosphate etherase|nr:N-acetylmuramic acid 6-phosphate etherase [Limnochordia bacterium]
MSFKDELQGLTTEGRNQATMNIDTASTTEIVSLITREDQAVFRAVQQEVPRIVQAADLLTNVLKQGGRIIYMGAGTSGRLGVLDAAELLPTFGVGQEQVTALIAGGNEAMFVAVELAEDDRELGLADFLAENPTDKDALLGIAASGRTPYVIGPMERAREMGLVTIGLTCNPHSELSKIAHVTIAPVVGPEAVTGSTRMKAGTAQKIVLNALSTTVMIKIGKVYQNLMVDMVPTNAKLKLRAEQIVYEVTGAPLDSIRRTLEGSSYNIKTAIVMLKANCQLEAAEALLVRAEGVVGRALQIVAKEGMGSEGTKEEDVQ